MRDELLLPAVVETHPDLLAALAQPGDDAHFALVPRPANEDAFRVADHEAALLARLGGWFNAANNVPAETALAQEIMLVVGSWQPFEQKGEKPAYGVCRSGKLGALRGRGILIVAAIVPFRRPGYLFPILLLSKGRRGPWLCVPTSR
jgi:hypothetical protein